MRMSAWPLTKAPQQRPHWWQEISSSLLDGKKLRLAFARLYLERLADGIGGKAASCMTESGEKFQPETG